MVPFCDQAENLLSVLGALFDIAGAALLACVLVFVKPDSILKQSMSGFGGISPSLIKMFSEQKVDASFGLGLLVFGFLIQGAAGYGYKTTSGCIFLIGTGCLTLVLVVYLALRRRLAEKTFKRTCRTFRKQDGSLVWNEDQIQEFWATP
jgi:hypothetical protein